MMSDVGGIDADSSGVGYVLTICIWEEAHALCRKLWSGQDISLFTEGATRSPSHDLGALFYRGAFAALLGTICSAFCPC